MNGFGMSSSLMMQIGYKIKTAIIFSFLVSIYVIFCILFVSCSYNSLNKKTWKDAKGTRTLIFTESTFRWKRKDTNRDLIGTYKISKDAIILSFDDGDRYTGFLTNGTLSFTANAGFSDEEHIEFYRVR
jgi:hypothetical protein